MGAVVDRGDLFPVSSTHVLIAWLTTVLTGGYMLPWAVAATRQKENTVAIAWISLLLGWTIVGWLVALVMAFAPRRSHYVPVLMRAALAPQPRPPAGVQDRLPGERSQ